MYHKNTVLILLNDGYKYRPFTQINKNTYSAHLETPYFQFMSYQIWFDILKIPKNVPQKAKHIILSKTMTLKTSTKSLNTLKIYHKIIVFLIT